jgi:ABC-2 type transport system permease protein
LEWAAVTRLVWAEVTRLLSRKFTGIALIVLLLGLGGFQLVVNDALSPLTDTQLAAAQRAYEQSHKDWVDNHEKYEQECRDTGGTPEECTFPEPKPGEFSVQPTPFKEAAQTALELSTALVAVVVFMIAASFIGAEYSSGSIASWLTFIPRRGHVFWSKLLTVGGFAALLGAFSATLAFGAVLTLAHLHGSRLESLRELAGIGARSILPVVVLAVVGFCLGLLTRHTAAAIGVLLAFVLVWFVRVGPLSSFTWAQRITPWTPEGNIAAIVDRGYTYSVPVQRVSSDGVDIDFVQHTVSLTHGAVYWSILLTLVVLSSLLIFRRRDVI